MARQYPNMAKTIMHNQNARMSQMNKIMKGPKGQPMPGPGMRLPGGGQGSMPPSSMPRGPMQGPGGPGGPPGPDGQQSGGPNKTVDGNMNAQGKQ